MEKIMVGASGMIRLAVNSGDDAIRREVGRRLSRAQIVPTDEDAVLFIEPGNCDQERVERCLSVGKHVLVTGGGGLSAIALEMMVALAKSAGARFVVVNPERYLPSRQLIWQEIQAGKLGEPGLIRWHCWETVDSPAALTDGLPAALLCGLDVVLWLMGKPPYLVFAVEQSADAADAPAGRYLQVHLGFPGGGMAILDYSGRLPQGEAYTSLSVIGSSGAAYADDHHNMQLLYRGGRPQGVRAEERIRQFALLAQDFVDGLQAGRDFSAGLREWQGVLAVAAAIKNSVASRESVHWEGS